MQKRITFLLGAGASCKSQPLVSDMKDRMNQLLFLLDPLNGTSFDSTLRDRTGVLFNKYNPIIAEANKHYTVDTYAKKLWLVGDSEKLAVLKEFLNLYFLFEQDSSKTVYVKFPKYDNERIWDDIGQTIDYRYDVFFATLLTKDEGSGSLQLPENINVISWNYDNQFELAYKEFLKDIRIEKIPSLLNIYPTSTNSELQNDKSKIIKLNGSCIVANIDRDKNIEEVSFYNQLTKLIDNKPVSNNINFAWEGVVAQNESINQAIDILKTTSELVVIGYSFPNFNRDVDRKLFTIKSFDKIYVQVPKEKEFNKIKGRILNMTAQNYYQSTIVHIDDEDQFYIPN